MANNYINVELADVHFAYGLAVGNTREAHIYQEQFPGFRILGRSMFSRICHLGDDATSVLNRSD
jgi:hypothetical protein